MILYLNSNGDEEKKTPAKKINDQPVVVIGFCISILFMYLVMKKRKTPAKKINDQPVVVIRFCISILFMYLVMKRRKHPPKS